MRHFDDVLRRALNAREDQSLLRRRLAIEPLDATHVELDGRRLINFASNDYLGLTHHRRMLAALHDVGRAGSGAAGLISGHSILQLNAEHALAKWKGAEAAMLLPSGYQANVAAVQTLVAAARAAERPVRFLIDKLAHASLIDAVRGEAFRIYPHNGLPKLQRLLDGASSDEMQVVVTESIFSMDGDAADLVGLRALKQQYDFVLLLDEAHATGVYGDAGQGLASEIGVADVVDISVVTLSKALGLAGGAVCGSATFINAIENFSRAAIYTTAVAPAVVRLTLEAIAICRDEPDRRARLRHSAEEFRTRLAAAGIAVGAGDSPIIPIRIGAADRALQTAAAMRHSGFFVVAVRPPTVPPGQSRLRITLSSEHSAGEIASLTEWLLHHLAGRPA